MMMDRVDETEGKTQLADASMTPKMYKEAHPTGSQPTAQKQTLLENHSSVSPARTILPPLRTYTTLPLPRRSQPHGLASKQPPLNTSSR